MVPARGDAGEVLLGGGGPALLHDRASIPVGGDDRVVRVDPGQDAVDRIPDRSVRCEIEERPGTFTVLVDDAGVGEQAEVPGGARLRLPEDVDQVAHRELAVGEQRHDS